MSILFLSDLHLDPDRPAITELFLSFLRGPAAAARDLYILGDLFEAWVGDDAPLADYRRVIRGLAGLGERGVGVHVMHGNRDFLLGRRFANAAGATLLDDPTVIDLYGRPTAIMHGDTLCTDDVAYQEFRRKVRRRWLQRAFLSLPRRMRYRIAADMRHRSRQHQTHKPPEIMDVNAQAVRDAFRRIGVTQIIHGHTHRPGVHAYTVDGRACRRIVLGDWYEQGSVLWCDRDGCRLQMLTPGTERGAGREDLPDAAARGAETWHCPWSG